jgi:hypothetical protein
MNDMIGARQFDFLKNFSRRNNNYVMMMKTSDTKAYLQKKGPNEWVLSDHYCMDGWKTRVTHR